MKALMFSALFAAGAAQAAPIEGAILLGDPRPAQAAACKAMAQTQTAGPTSLAPHKLSQMPPAMLMHAVLRTIGGCPVAEIRYEGRTYYAPSIPHMQPLSPTAFEVR